MEIALLWTLHLVFASALAAAAAARLASPARPRSVWGLVTLAIAPLAALHAYLTLRAFELRFDDGIAHAPWWFSIALLVAHLAVSAWIVLRARNGSALFGWSSARLIFAAGLALGFNVATLRVLDLEARLELSGLRTEAGRVAYELVPQIADEDENAAGVYERVANELFEGQEALDLGPFKDALANNASLAANDSAVRQVLERSAKALVEIRAASQRPHCQFEAGNATDLVVVPRVLPVYRLTQLLALSARVRAQDGDVAGAVEDVLAALRMCTHLARAPTLLGLAAGSVARAEVCATVLALAASDSLQGADLGRLHEALAEPYAPLMRSATRMEEAFGLASVSSLLADGETKFSGVGESLFEWTGPLLYAPFLLRKDVLGYRAVIAELLALSDAPPAQLRAAADDAASRASVRSRGVLASVMAPNMARVFLQVRRTDALVELTRLALAAAREKLATGRFPAEFGPWSGPVENVRFTSDGASLTLVRTDAEDFGAPLEVALPPRATR